MKKHRKTLAVAAALTVIGALSLVSVLTPDFGCNSTVLIVNEGDTVWSLAERYCTGSIEAAVDAIVAEYGTDIRPTQAMRLP